MPRKMLAKMQKEAYPAIITGTGVVAGIGAARLAKTYGTDKVEILRSYPEVASVISIAVGAGLRNVNRSFAQGWIGGASGAFLLQLLGRFMSVPSLQLGSNGSVEPAVIGNGSGQKPILVA